MNAPGDMMNKQLYMGINPSGKSIGIWLSYPMLYCYSNGHHVLIKKIQYRR